MIDVFDRSPTFWLAPMAGISNMAFRLIAKKEGADVVCTEMISADGVFRENLRSWDLTKVSEDERPVSIQLFGSKPEVMAKAARMM
ncbi:tRNA dihydrouridine synthase DusB, partial [Candidatus Poribacteria bacterium]|nr:tRNA dihydrouridine synthase DusB [Candidatus Poribacteria bacterium]